jgi:hypothetical protein
VTPRIGHREFLAALQGLVVAYGTLDRAVAAALPTQLGAVAAVDPLTRVALEQFGEPLVRWFGRGSRVPGVRVADGALVFDAGDGGERVVRFVDGVEAEHEADLPADWRARSTIVARMTGAGLELAAP